MRDAGDSADHDADAVAEAGGDGRDDGEVAVAAGELGEAPAVGDGQLDLGDHLGVAQVGLERADEEVGGADPPGRARPGDVDGAVAREQDRRQFGRRVGVGEAAGDRAAAADRGVPDPAGGLREQGVLVLLGEGQVADEGAEVERVAAPLEPGEAGDVVDVDQHLGPGHAQGEDGHQALAPGEDLPLAVGGVEGGDGVRHAGRPVVGERWALHRVLPGAVVHGRLNAGAGGSARRSSRITASPPAGASTPTPG